LNTTGGVIQVPNPLPDRSSIPPRNPKPGAPDEPLTDDFSQFVSREANGGTMTRAKPWLAAMLATALTLPSAAGAQEPTGPLTAAPPAPVEPRGQVRLTFDGRRPADPWAVFGTAKVATDSARSEGGGAAVRTSAPPASRPGTLRLETVAPTRSAPAARMGMAGQNQSQSWTDWWTDRPGLLLIAIVAGVVVLVATGHVNEIPWLSGR
jgi:hypothetical protein